MLDPCHSSWHNSLSTKCWLLVNQISNIRENLFSTSWYNPHHSISSMDKTLLLPDHVYWFAPCQVNVFFISPANYSTRSHPLASHGWLSAKQIPERTFALYSPPWGRASHLVEVHSRVYDPNMLTVRSSFGFCRTMGFQFWEEVHDWMWKVTGEYLHLEVQQGEGGWGNLIKGHWRGNPSFLPPMNLKVGCKGLCERSVGNPSFATSKCTPVKRGLR